ncbi:MAG: exonuclease SbcCD subunit D [Acutalibacteraceae bacterium]|nr:exonuclease SbcCD subunit D [Acutalibacteraceae bacterium]
MKSVRILHTADLHIGAQCSYLGAGAPVRRAEILKTFEKITELCKNNSVDLLLIAGDLFDSNQIEASFVNSVITALESLENTKTVIALGNHDPFTADSPFANRKIENNVHILETKDSVITFDQLGCRVYGSSFDGVYNQGDTRFSLTVPQDDYINLMVIHGEARADMSCSYRPITPEFVKYSGMDYIALGHVHTRSEVQYMGTTALAYCGCPEGQGFDESGEKGVYMGEISKGKADLAFIPTAQRTHYCIDVDITDCDDIEKKVKECIENTDKDFSRHYFRITLKGKRKADMVIDTSALIASIAPTVAFFKIKDKTSEDIDYSLLAQENTLKGYFVSLMLDKISTATEDEKKKYNLALEIGLKSFNGEVSFDED